MTSPDTPLPDPSHRALSHSPSFPGPSLPTPLSSRPTVSTSARRRALSQHPPLPGHRRVRKASSPGPADEDAVSSGDARPALQLVGGTRSGLNTSGIAWARHTRWCLRVTDLVIISATAAVAVSDWQAAGAQQVVAKAAIAVAIALIWFSMLSVFHTRDSRVLSVGVTEYKRVTRATTGAFGILAIAFVVAQTTPVSPSGILVFPAGLAVLLLARWLWRNWLVRQGTRGRALSRVVVVGQPADAEYVVQQLARCSSSAYTVAGVVLDGDPDHPAPPTLSRMPVHHDLCRVAQTAADLGADAVVVAGPPSGRAEFVRDLAWELEGTATDLILATGLVNVAGPRIHLRPMEGLPLIHVEIPQFEGGRHVVKRAFDILVSGTALLLLAPVMAAVALAVRLEDGGPALFRQKRVGRDGTTFSMVKFRSMVVDADAALARLADRNEGAGVLFKMRDDPRVTRVGRVIRKYSLDELPQLWNILLGDMSVVGPRPPLPHEVSAYEDHVHRRLYIRPGLTGMWQVSGRSDLSWEQSVQLDLYYVENWSLIGDLMIMWRTVRVLLRPVGAY